MSGRLGWDTGKDNTDSFLRKCLSLRDNSHSQNPGLEADRCGRREGRREVEMATGRRGRRQVCDNLIFIGRDPETLRRMRDNDLITPDFAR